MVGVLLLNIQFHAAGIANGECSVQIAVTDAAAAQTLTTTVKNFLISAGAVLDKVSGNFVPQSSNVS